MLEVKVFFALVSKGASSPVYMWICEWLYKENKMGWCFHNKNSNIKYVYTAAAAAVQ